MMRSLNISNFRRGFVAAVASLAIIAPVGVLAQQPAAIPSYARQHSGETIHGRITQVNGEYGLLVNDDRGYVDDVTLHEGTIINPTGIRLQIGMSVTIYGHAVNATLAADEIDTPYNIGYPVYSVYPGPIIGGWGFGGGWGGGWGGGYGGGWGGGYGGGWGGGYGRGYGGGGHGGGRGH